MKNNNFKQLLLGIVIGISIAFLTMDIYVRINPTAPAPSNNNLIHKNVTIVENSISEAIEEIYDAVVFINNYSGNSIVSTGTGFVYKADNKYAYLLTNHHVVENSTRIEIINSDREKADAYLLGSDKYADIAVLRVSKNAVKKVAKLGNLENNNIGDTVFTVGSPMGIEFFGTITKGVISGKERFVDTDEITMRVIQTDAAINPGNSGGPLVNIMGEVIGVNTLKFVKAEVEGMGFAIPIDDAMKYAEKLEKGEKIVRPLLGVTLVDIENLFYSPQLKIDKNIKSGAVINEVYDNTPASRAGLKTNDIIIKVNEIEVPNIVYLRYTLYQYNIGDTITLTIIRDGKEIQKQVKLDMALD